MSVHERLGPPSGHGEVLCSPPFAEWSSLARRNAESTASWPAELRELREAARLETVAEARRYSREIGVSEPPEPVGDLIIMTGHQPELYHPGIWVKNFLVQRMADEVGAVGIDLVVDTDACSSVVLRVPCLRPEVEVCEPTLVADGQEASYIQIPVPDADVRAAFRTAGAQALESLPAPALSRHFGAFCDSLETAAALSGDLGTLMTAARRFYERPAETDYLEIPVSAQARLESYRRFAASLVQGAERFRAVTNEALAAYRQRTGARSVVQPFPDLGGRGTRVEVPFWILRDRSRLSASVDSDGTLYADDTRIASLGSTLESAAEALAADDLLLVPKAIALTMFQRLFVADLFVHGTGGGRYDRVTDAVIAAYYGIEAPAFVVASMTLLLPIGAHIGSDADVSAIEQRLHRLEHNPDAMLAEVEFDTVVERVRAEDLARTKADLVSEIAASGANRKSIGTAIRETNAALATLLQPVAEDLRRSLELARAERDALAVLTDRTYPYCLWDPREVLDKVR